MNARGRALPLVALVLLCALGIGLVQPGLALSVHRLRQRDDVFLLPPPNQLRVMTLGYRAAATDLLWAKLILEYGLHWQERRSFPDVTRYIDGILVLEPDFKTLYEFLDTIILYPAPPGASEQDARTARRYLERGTRERPYDPAMWLRYGQFLAFLAPSFIKDRDEAERWRVDGAYAITRAVELGSESQRSLAATSILSRSGERKATIEHLERSYAMTDDPEMREQILARLLQLKGSGAAEQALSIVEHEWRSRYAFLSRGQALLIGPRRSPSACAGPESHGRRECPKDWNEAVAESR